MKTTDCGTGSRAATIPTQHLTDTSSTPFEDSFDTPLHLVAGYGAGLAVAVAGLGAALGVLAAFAAPLAPWQSMTGVVCSLLVAGHWLYGTLRRPGAQIRLVHDGAVTYREHDRMAWRGRLKETRWYRPPVAVIVVELPWGAEHCPVFRYRQDAGTFRRLRVWLRHRTPED